MLLRKAKSVVNRPVGSAGFAFAFSPRSKATNVSIGIKRCSCGLCGVKWQAVQVIVCLSILFFCPVVSSWDEFDKGPYLQNVGKTHITIMWETTYSTESQVDYGITEDCDLFFEDLKEVKLHEVTLSPLRPNTLYYYEISRGFTTKTGTFRTAPDQNIPFKFVIYGDSQANPDIHRNIAKNIQKINPALILHTGDLVSNGTRNYQWESLFFEPLREVINHIPLFPCLGNHERNARNYFNFFSLPNNESWYSFNYSNCHFVILDTNKDYKKGSNQYKWLRNDLENANTKWKFVYFHHPPYSAGRHGSNAKVRSILTPLFRRQGVDIVFSGHDHTYQRSLPINSAFNPNEAAVTYVVSGGGGGKLYDLTPNKIWTAAAFKLHNFCVVNVDFGRLDFKAFDTDGKVLDQFTIAKEEGKYRQYAKTAIPYERIEFEKAFPTNITSPVVLLEAGKKLMKGGVKIQNPFPNPVEVKIVWHELNGWDIKPKQTVIKIDSKQTERIPFTFHPPRIDAIWPTPKFSVVYNTGPILGEVTGNQLGVLLPRELSCKRTDTPIELDGRLQEDFWRNVLPADKFIRADGSDLAQKQTIAKVVLGENAVYFAFVCDEPKTKALSASVDKRDGDITNDETVIVSLSPHSDDNLVYQFGVNCEGTEYDSKDGHVKWSGKWQSETRVNDENWTVEMAIPLGVLELSSPPEKGAKWKINFFRSTMEPEKSEWSPTLSSPLKFDRLGLLIIN